MLATAWFYHTSREFFLPILSIDLVSEYILLSYFFSLLIRSEIVRKILVFSNIPFLTYWLFVFINTDKSAYNNGPQLVELLFFIVVIIYYFFERMRYTVAVPLYQTLSFWISVGLFVYFSGVFFYILLVETYFSKSPSADRDRILNELKMISCSVVILKNLILGFAVTVKETGEEAEEYNFNIPLDMDLDSFESFTPKNNLN